MSNNTTALLPRPIHPTVRPIVTMSYSKLKNAINKDVTLLPRPIHPSLYEMNHQLAVRIDKFETHSGMRYLYHAYGFEDCTNAQIYLFENCLYIKDIYANYHCTGYYKHPVQEGIYNINTVSFVILMEGTKVLEVMYKDYNTTLPDFRFL